MTTQDGPVKINKVVRTRSRRKGPGRKGVAKGERGSASPKLWSKASLKERLLGLTRRQKALILVLLLLIPLVSYTAIQLYARSKVDQAEVDVERLRLVGFEDHYMLFEAQYQVKNPSSMSARVEPSQLEVHYKGSRVGDIWLPELELDSGTHEYTVRFRFLDSGSGSYGQLTTDLVLYGRVQVVLKGTITVHNIIGLDLPLDKSVRVRNLSL